METWRDTASPAAQADLDALLDSCLGQAIDHLAKRRALAPFAQTAAGGQVVAMAMAQGEPGGTTADDLATLWDGLRAGRDGYAAVAVAADVRLPEGRTDAVRVELEHKEGIALVVFLPYKLRRSGPKAPPENLIATRGRRVVWPE